MKVDKAPAFDEIDSIPEVRTEDVPAKRKLFEEAVGRPTTLEDDDIVNLIAYSEDDRYPADWVKQMQRMEDGLAPETCNNAEVAQEVGEAVPEHA